MKKENLLQVENLSVNLFHEGNVLPVLNNISFSISKGEILALVGESGCGKSITSLSLTKLLPIKKSEYKAGKIIFEGKDLLQANHEELLKVRGSSISYIFQDPFTSLNPLKRIKDQIIESYLIHISPNEKEAIEKAKHLLNKVGLTDLDDRLNAYPNQMSGGMLQRICIASALMCDPQLLIADEPTSALDVTIQSQLIDLLLRLREEIHMSILFITHDLALVSSLADSIAVMYAGQIAEYGDIDTILDNPKHPYTIALLQSIPSKSKDSHKDKLKVIEGIVPTPLNYPVGCNFYDRCESKLAQHCKDKKPDLIQLNENQKVACFAVKS